MPTITWPNGSKTHCPHMNEWERTCDCKQEDDMSYTGPATTYLHSITGGETGLKPLEWNSKPVCATDGCNSATTGKSKYCSPHAREARAAWLSKVKASSEERETRTEAHVALWRKACEAARKAHAEAIPTPMTVVEQNVITGEPKRSWHVSEGACGFGTVKVRPANSSFAIFLTRNGYARKSYTGGVTISTNYGSQSIARAEAAAYAMADVLREAGINAYGSSNLD